MDTRSLNPTASKNNKKSAGKETQAFQFSTIRSVQVQQHTIRASQCVEMYISLVTGKEITLSQSSYTCDLRQKALALKHHREVAEKMRASIGLETDIGDRAEDVSVPTEEEIREEWSAIWTTVSSIFNGTFAGKPNLQTRIELVRHRIAQNLDNAEDWEQLAWLLVRQKETLQEGLTAYRRAEKLYRDGGRTTKAELIASILRQADV